MALGIPAPRFTGPRPLLAILAASAALSLGPAACSDATGPTPLTERNLHIEPRGVSLFGVGDTATLRLVDADSVRVTGDIQWSSLNEAVALVDTRGRLTAASSGQATIMAATNNTPLAYGLVTVSVSTPPVARFMVDTLARPDFVAVWARSPDDVYAATSRQVVYHFDGTSWRDVGPEPDYGYLEDLDGTSSSVLAAGWNMGIKRYDGASWTEEVEGSFGDLFVASDTVAYAVGRAGSVVRYDGSTWTPLGDGPDVDLESVWVASDSDMFAAGWRTGVYHYDGQAWSLMDAPEELTVWGLLWGTASDNVYAGGYPDLWHYDGTTWTALNWNRGARSLVGRGPTDIWGLTYYSNGFMRYDGAGWRTISFATVWYGEPVSLNAMALDSTGTVYAAGSNGAMARHAPDASSYQWQLERVGVSRDPITALWSARPFDVFAGSGGGPISRGQEGEWTGVAYIGFGAMDLWGTSDRNVYAVGQRSLMRWNGSQWREVDIGSPTLTAIWGSGPDDIFLAGLSRVLHYNGDTWSGRVAPTPLYDVWGASSDQVWAVGGRAGSTETAEILFYDGSRWRRQSTFDGRPLRAVWGTSPTDIFAVGEGGLILHYDGESWSDMASPTSGDLTDLWGSAPDDVYAVGDDGAFHYDGSGWSRLAGAPPGDYESVWGSSMGPVHFGINGRIISAHR